MLVPLPTKSLHPFRGLSPYHMGAQRLVPLPEFERVFFQDYSGWMGEAVRRGLIRPQETLPTHGPDGTFNWVDASALAMSDIGSSFLITTGMGALLFIL